MARYDLGAPVPDRPKRPQPPAPSAAAPPPPPAPPTLRETLGQLDPRRVALGLGAVALVLSLLAGLLAWRCRRHVEVVGRVRAEGKKADVQRCTFLVTTPEGRELVPSRDQLQLNADGSFHISVDFYAWTPPESLNLRVRLKRHKTRRQAGLVIRDGTANAGTIVLWRGRPGPKVPPQ